MQVHFVLKIQSDQSNDLAGIITKINFNTLLWDFSFKSQAMEQQL